MARKTLAEMWTFIQPRLWDTMDDGLLVAATVKEVINLCHQDLFEWIKERDPKFGRKHSAVIDLVADTEFIEAPADYDFLLMMEYKTHSSPDMWEEMIDIEPDEREKYYGGATVTARRIGRARFGYYHDGINNTVTTAPVYRFGILPVPTANATGVIRLYYGWTAPTLADADKILIPESWTFYLALKTMEALGVNDEAIVADTYFQKLLQKEEKKCHKQYHTTSRVPSRIRKRKFRFR